LSLRLDKHAKKQIMTTHKSYEEIWDRVVVELRQYYEHGIPFPIQEIREWSQLTEDKFTAILDDIIIRMGEGVGKDEYVDSRPPLV
jgi:hypothetical protein